MLLVLLISEKMRGQIRGLEQAQRNAQDGISYVQTAEGAMNEVSLHAYSYERVERSKLNGTYSDCPTKQHRPRVE